MRVIKGKSSPEETTPEETKAMKIIVAIVVVSFVIFLIGALCLLIAYAKCNCHAV